MKNLIDFVCLLTFEQREAVLLCYMLNNNKVQASKIIGADIGDLKKTLVYAKIRLATMICYENNNFSKWYNKYVFFTLPIRLFYVANTFYLSDMVRERILLAVKSKVRLL